jgi:hypothetical protein
MDAHHDEHGPIGEHVEGKDEVPRLRVTVTIMILAAAALAFLFIFTGMGQPSRKAAEVVYVVSGVGGLVALVAAIISLVHKWFVQALVLTVVVILAAVAFIIAQPFTLT